MKIKNILSILCLAILVTIFSGCTINNPGGGGFFKSADGGMTFNQGTSELASVLVEKNILSLEINPSNNKEIFVGTLSSGLFKSVDGGETWLTGVNSFQSIYDIELIPNTAIIYMIAKKNGRGKLLKSDNNGEVWEELYTEKDETSFLTSMAIIRNNFNEIYISNSKGGLFKSEDAGITWKNIYWADSLIRKIEIDNVNSNIIYLATNQSGLLMSENRGQEFNSIIQGGYIYNVLSHPNREGFLYVSSKNGLQRSLNKGSDWETLNTLVKSEELVSRGLAINPNNTQEIYYTSGKTFYKSSNEGETWMPVQFDIGVSIEIIKIDPGNSQLIYLGTNNRGGGSILTPTFN